MADLILRDCDPAELRDAITKAVAAELLKILADASAPRLVDRLKMAELAGIGTATLDNLVSAGKVPSVTVGRRRLFEPRQVIDAMTANANGRA